MFLYSVCVCEGEHLTQLYPVGVTVCFFFLFFFLQLTKSLYLGCACDWQVNLLCSLLEMSVPGGLSYMHFTPFLI